jgi:hypothetical protein
VRYLSETNTERSERMEVRRRRVLTSIGRVLVSSGHARAGLDTLAIASATGWDLNVIRTMRSAAFAAGDSAIAWTMTARLVADPSTPDRTRDTLTASARTALGDARWSALEREGRQVFSQRVLAESETRSVPGTPTLRDANGRAQTLRELGAGRPTVVVFWSRSCGWALEALAGINDIAQRLEENGGRVLLVVDDEIRQTPELTAVLEAHKAT